ncbi:hypothetical protein [Gluconobacter albidus]|uniref:hypothetical protein n=1 Tax=Gluconobacter albidus TaxID=318683 RepID=UPI001B8D1C0F|nr:hypothetical protein [Gluconobacter albidus]MBS1028316.1 hypothetical protein [Gluconobacter albidus]
MRRLLVAVAFVGLAGCATDHTAQKKEMIASKAKCAAEYPLKIGSYLKRETCIDTAEFTYSAETGEGYKFAFARADARDKYARQADAGQINEEEFKNLVMRDVASSSARIRAENDEEYAERRQQAAAAMLQSGAFSPRPTYQAPLPTMSLQPLSSPVNVSPKTTNCQSYASGSYLNTRCTN